MQGARRRWYRGVSKSSGGWLVDSVQVKMNNLGNTKKSMCHLYLIWFAALENNWLPYLITHTHAWVIVAKSIVNRLHSFEHFLPLLLNFALHAGFEVLPWAAESAGAILAQCVLLNVTRATRIPIFICAGCMGAVWRNRVVHFIMFAECCAALFWEKKNRKKT